LPDFSVTETPGEGIAASTPDGDVYRLGRAGFALDGDGETCRIMLRLQAR
jgi:Cu2+-exporting ATPase